VWRIDSSWESQAYAAADSSGLAALPFDEVRSHGSLTVSDWLSPRLRYSITGGVDSWRGRSYTGRTALAGGSIERRSLDDRLMLSAAITAWAPASFHTSGVRAAYQSSRGTEGWVYLADAGADRASGIAPLALWPGAGDGHSRDLLMRAHPLLEGGAIELNTESVFGRTVFYTHGEVQRWVASAAPVRFGVAAFADIARASRREAPAIGAVTQTDAGGGLQRPHSRRVWNTAPRRRSWAPGRANAMTIGWQY
jgi:hypothetical protein